MATGNKGLWRRVRENLTARWTFAYMATAWVLLQVVIQLAQIFEWPQGVARISAIALAAGAPLVATLIWLREVRTTPRSRLVGGLLLGASAVSVVVAAALLARGPALATRAVSDGVPVVAVLPITDLRKAAPKDNFTESLRETMLDRLSREPAFKLSSRTTAGTVSAQGRTVPEIAAVLGATHVIEASIVTEADGANRLTAQLISANDLHLFSHEQAYAPTTSLDDAMVDFTTAVVARTRFMLGPDDWDSGHGAVDRSSQSWLAYKRAMMEARYATPQASVESLRKLVNADPGFARAYAMIAVLQPELWSTPREDKLREADESIARAEALEPGLPETALAKYVRLSWLTQDRDAAQAATLEQAFGPALARNVFAHVHRGWMARRQGRLEDAFAAFEQAVRVDANYQWPAANYAMLGIDLRKYDLASSYLASMSANNPRTVNYRVWFAHAEFLRSGETRPLADAIDRIVADFPAFKDGVWELGARAQLAAFEGRFADAESTAAKLGARFDRFGFGFGSYNGRWVSDTDFRLEMLGLLGKTKAARTLADARELELRRDWSSADRPLPSSPAGFEPWQRVRLAILRVHSGRFDEARALVAGLTGEDVDCQPLAAVLARVGERARAIDVYTACLEDPSGAHINLAALDPAWIPLRGEQRFKDLLASYGRALPAD